MYKLVIFDLDGTLLNTLDDLAAAGNYALTALGYPTHPVSAYRNFIGNGMPNLVHRMLPDGHTEAQHSECYALFQQYYSAHGADLTLPYSGIVQLVADLDSMGITCCVNTNKDHIFAQQLIERFFGSHIKAVIGRSEKFPLKPSPEAALELCRRFNSDKRAAIYVGDSDVDIRTAAAAEIDSCSVLWGFRTRDELKDCAPTYFAENSEQLADILTAQK